MRCAYQSCQRKVGLRRFCQAHRIWVEYLAQLREKRREEYWRKRGAGA